MPELDQYALRYLAQCFASGESLGALRQGLDKIEKFSSALGKGANLGELLEDPQNRKSLIEVFGVAGLEMAIQLIVRSGLARYQCRSFTLRADLRGRNQMDMLYRAVGGWGQFQAVVCFHKPGATPEEAITVINPAKSAHWNQIDSLPAGTLVSVYIKSAQRKRAESQELLATERYEAIFEAIQQKADLPQTPFGTAVQIQSQKERRANPGRRATDFKRSAVSKPISASSTPSMIFRVVINKIDVFVHAGNAQLIVSHLRDYPGRAGLFVLRAEKKRVSLDADSIWSAEIRNGETVLFEFYGPEPSEDFLKELGKKVNKYTQMDKIA